MFGGPSGNLPSVMKHDFSQVPKAEIPRSSFDRTHSHKTTFDSGKLIPFYVDEALPGDTFNVKATTFARLATPIVPIMDNLYCDTFFFAVPIRLVWENFKKFMGEQNNPGDSTSYLVPQMQSPAATGHQEESLSDYFGLPTKTPGYYHSSLWHRAYNLIWNTHFRDQNLQNAVTVDTGDGPDSEVNYRSVLRRGKRHDYFTSCLPWPQKGTAVSIPLGTSAPVLRTPNAPASRFYLQSTDTPASAVGDINIDGSGFTKDAAGNHVALGPNGGMYTDLSTATAATINSLRQAFQLQKLYERDARGGTRYTEIIRSHFGVTSPDARLQRPEYLGGGSAPIKITPVPQTSASTDTPQGNLAAFGTFSHSNNGFVKSFTEHTLIIGMVCVRADLNYQQGLERMFSRRTKYDFYWPALSHIGEQAVLNKEIYTQGTAGAGMDDQTFGYQERYAEYRYKPSRVTGLFRSNANGSLDYWHLAQDFASPPVLDSTFIQDTPPVDRVVAVADQPEFLFDSFIKCTCARPMPVYSVPGMIDHF